MIYIAVDKSKLAYLYNRKPKRDNFRDLWNITPTGSYMEIPFWLMKALIGKELTWRDEPIKITESFTKYRSCDNCKYNKGQDGFMIFCDKEMCQDGFKMMWHSFTKDFCCNKWESNA